MSIKLPNYDLISVYLLMVTIRAQVKELSDMDLSELYKQSKQLSDLCRQEIKRRKEQS